MSEESYPIYSLKDVTVYCDGFPPKTMTVFIILDDNAVFLYEQVTSPKE